MHSLVKGIRAPRSRALAKSKLILTLTERFDIIDLSPNILHMQWSSIEIKIYFKPNWKSLILLTWVHTYYIDDIQRSSEEIKIYFNLNWKSLILLTPYILHIWYVTKFRRDKFEANHTLSLHYPLKNGYKIK